MANITGIPARYVMWVVLCTIIIMSGSDAANADLSQKSVEINDLPETITFSERTAQPVGYTMPGRVVHVLDGCMPVILTGSAVVREGDGSNEIFWKFELDKGLRVGDYLVIVEADRQFNKKLRIFDATLGNSYYPKINCDDATSPVMKSKSSSANILTIFGASDKNDPPSLNSLYMIMAICTIAIGSVIYLRNVAPPERIMRFITDNSSSYGGSSRPVLLKTTAGKIFAVFNNKPVRIVLNNIAVGSTYLLIMSFIATSCALFFREYFITRFGFSPPPDFMVGQWYDLFFADNFLFHVSENITHPNLYLFYAIFFLPFMIQASRIWLGNYSGYRQDWGRKIRNYIIVYLVLIGLLAAFFMYILSQLCTSSSICSTV